MEGNKFGKELLFLKRRLLVRIIWNKQKTIAMTITAFVIVGLFFLGLFVNKSLWMIMVLPVLFAFATILGKPHPSG